MSRPLSTAAMALVLAAFGSTALLHVDRVPPWCAIAALAAIAWRIAHQRRHVPLPGPLLRIGLALLLTASILLAFRTLGGLAAGTALLMAMGAVKLLEMRERRDAVVVVLVSFVQLLAACLDRGGLVRLPLYLVAGWICCAALTALGARTTPPLRQAFAEAGRALLWGLPLALVLFLFVPRLPGALWSMPNQGQAQSGLSDRMSPGSISELALSDAPAFRVSFDGQPPPPDQRYWRGPVLHDFDGETWTRGSIGIRLEFEPRGEPLDYEVLLEPSGRNWWFGLETIASVTARGVFHTWDGQIISFRPVTTPMIYRARSYLQVRTPGPLPRSTRRNDTRLPPGRNPRTLALATQLRAQAADDRTYVDAVVGHFRTGGFEYTLTPPLMEGDAIDALLFDARQGFCGHFASAFVTLMRAGGVPARVVTGYLGGEWNDIGDYLLVRQSDAHAWAEVWLDGQGWMRVDPTAVVSPQRLDSGLDRLLEDQMSAVTRLRRDSPLLRDLMARWDATNHWWQERVLGFNQAAQQGLLERLGLRDADYRTLAWLLMTGALAWAAIAMAMLARQRATRGSVDPLARQWETLRDAARRGGLAVEPFEPPRAVASRIVAAWPALAGPLQDFAEQYLRLRYGPGGATPGAVEQLDRQLRQLVRRLRRTPPLDAYADLAGRVPLYDRLPADLRPRVAQLATAFERRWHFTGCGGLLLTPFMRRAIAFTAAVPVVNRGAGLYAGLRSVLVYPDQFVVTRESVDEDGVVTEGTEVLSGQTEDTSRVLLSWDDVEQGHARDGGYDVVLHEFAHVIDHHLDGRLTRRDGDADASWHEVLEREYGALCREVDAGSETLIDPYGAEDPAEFFAVATETFFGRSAELRQRHAGLYSALARLYRLDPAAWRDGD
jgi:Mlc titration factor MtfA (ptsG expression regulator)/transglutaminase-like putative cysteine protease